MRESFVRENGGWPERERVCDDVKEENSYVAVLQGFEILSRRHADQLGAPERSLLNTKPTILKRYEKIDKYSSIKIFILY